MGETDFPARILRLAADHAGSSWLHKRNNRAGVKSQEHAPIRLQRNLIEARALQQEPRDGFIDQADSA
ncbi:hypothetical protein BOSE21B_110632 [Bosea sp. 21B]|nr:hypothetical protein BOSE21B_110632 [Bosea sp. 21B]CAD5278448.1 hypothetical protein BOSE7B_40584 [Bosea sp. 7B]VXB57660.1 hypothetical protein BOSE29B_110570 [Bosea sp. 29B]VXB99086.1 hypothetical protein BOSE125_160363 [Bosea sp. 125]VXC81150.1 hypothetical protein BOSE127_50291 [Bosea sp. 127]